MKNQICLITGANSGIGKITARELAKQNMTIVMVCRNRERGEQAQREIIGASGNNQVDLLLGDLSDMNDVVRLAREVRSRYPRLDILINNAGLIIEQRQQTSEGFEMTLAINHLGHFLLTNLLLDPLKKSSAARIINVSSEAHKYGRLDFNDLQLANQKYEPMRAYGNSKLANILFTRELANKVAQDSITVNSLHPGFVATNFGGQFDRPLYKAAMYLLRPFAISPEEGAQTSIYLASSPEVKGKSGLYFVKKSPKKPAKEAMSDYNARTLWEMSAQLTRLDERLTELSAGVPQAGVSGRQSGN